MTKVSAFLRHGTTGFCRLGCKADIRLGTSGEGQPAIEDVSDSFTRFINNRVEARSGKTEQPSAGIPRRDIAFQPCRRTVSPKNLLDAFVDVMH